MGDARPGRSIVAGRAARAVARMALRARLALRRHGPQRAGPRELLSRGRSAFAPPVMPPLFKSENVLDLGSDREVGETSDERFDRGAFARRAVELISPRRTTV